MISDGIFYDGLNNLYDIVKPFNPIIINSVKRYLSEHPELLIIRWEKLKNDSATQEKNNICHLVVQNVMDCWRSLCGGVYDGGDSFF